jgi:hypothetical protein
VPSGDIYRFEDTDDHLDDFGRNRLDQCGHHGTTWDFCSQCYTAILHRGVSGQNLVNVTLCQDYPTSLENLTFVEECLIARCHPVGLIVKLRPKGQAAFVNYYGLKGHMIVLPQDPGPLLSILPSSDLKFNDVIKVFWMGKSLPPTANLKSVLRIRKDKVLGALHFLVQHNKLYRDIQINYPLMDSWADDYIPTEIVENITCVTNSDHHEREGYTVSLQTGNDENDFAAAQDAALEVDSDEAVLTGSIMTDVDGERSRSDDRTLNALLEFKTNPFQVSGHSSEDAADSFDHGQDEPDQIQEPVISYATRGKATLMSAWEDPHYFTGAFPTLFPYGIGGHIDKRKVLVGLEAYAQWALNHHSRRFARHRSFLYLMYDVIRLRMASLGHRLLVKRRDWNSTMADIESLTADQLREAARDMARNEAIRNPVIFKLLQKMTRYLSHFHRN